MRLFAALMGGLIAGAIGAAIWAGISYAINYEIGWIAWGIGFLVGFGVRLGAQDWSGVLPGLLAVVLAALSILGGKYAAVSLHMTHAIGQVAQSQVTAQDIQSRYAREVVEKRMQENKPVKWAPGKSLETLSDFNDFPQDVQKEAAQRWNDLPKEQQAQALADLEREVKQIQEMFRGQVHSMAFWQSFNGMDVIFFILAAITSFRLGSGSALED